MDSSSAAIIAAGVWRAEAIATWAGAIGEKPDEENAIAESICSKESRCTKRAGAVGEKVYQSWGAQDTGAQRVHSTLRPLSELGGVTALHAEGIVPHRRTPFRKAHGRVWLVKRAQEGNSQAGKY